ncbi:hypothetical protein OPV22_016277 [Ensete ventricosum]|uniref:Growth-regulating factor n=1 Tax=Ensete ventricosum TaxID=4639 RepID=A0AAV8QYA0_ENSVE|nr:hypothetical protein OPV22_016277 [Ensete ventricosum]
MDFGGVVDMDMLVAASSDAGSVFSSSIASSDAELSRQIVFLGSSLQKNETSPEAEDHDMRCLKLARTDPKVASTAKVAPFLVPDYPYLFPDGAQMLSFSSTFNQEAMGLSPDGTLPYQHHRSAPTSTPSCLRNAGLCSGSFDVNMNEVLARVRGPFTPTQWLELERQALIYKYIVANVAIPPSLFIPFRTSLNTFGLSSLSVGSFGSSTSVGWGLYHQGYSGNDDPEPGRCRRTDGKKWRCSREAVADQKYCERHINRGRHRSRKHVEGCTSHAAKAIPSIAPSQSVSAIQNGGISGKLTTSQHQTESLQTNMTNCCPTQFDRITMSNGNVNGHTQNSEGLSMLDSFNSRSMSYLFPVSEEHNPFKGSSSETELGHMSMDSLLKPQSSSFSDNISHITIPMLNNQQNETHPLRRFTDDWSRNQSDHSNISGSEEYDTIDVGLGAAAPSEASNCQPGWLPISWESSMAGPLGEVLNNNTSNMDDQCRNLLSSSCRAAPGVAPGWRTTTPMKAMAACVMIFLAQPSSDAVHVQEFTASSYRHMELLPMS